MPETSIAAYPHRITISTRLEDLGLNGCLGSVAYARYFEQARVTFIDQVLLASDPGAKPLPLMVVAGVTIDYLAEGTHGPDVQLGIGVTQLGRTSYRLQAICQQEERCIATHAATMVMTGDLVTLPHTLRRVLEKRMVGTPAGPS